MSTETITPLWEDGATLDLSSIDPNAKHDLIPKGEYGAFCDEAELTTSAAGEAMIVLKFELKDDEDAKVHGRILRKYILFERDFGKVDLVKTGVALNPEIDFTVFRPADCSTYFEGRQCQLKVGVRKRKDNGEPANEIIAVKAATTDSFWGA